MDLIDGTFFKAGGKKLYLKAAGSGFPALVIEPGWGSLSTEWTEIQYAISEFTTVMTYDRAGYGESPEGIKPRTGKQIVSELYELLKNSGVPGPYIFLGQAAGGLYTRIFAARFPNETAGLIFLDSMTGEDHKVNELDVPFYKQNLSLEARMNNIENLTKLDEEKLHSFITPYLDKLYPDSAPIIRNALIQYQTDPLFYKTIIEEFKGYDETCRQIEGIKNFPEIPVKVICRDPDQMKKISKQINVPETEAAAIEDLWQQQNKELAKLSAKSEFNIAEGADQMIHMSKPEVVINAVKSMMDNFGSYVELG